VPGPPPEDHPRLPVDALADFYLRVFVRAGLPGEDAATLSQALLTADLRGIESYGAPLAPGYVARLRAGLINRRPRIRPIAESAGTLVLDGDDGAGPVVGVYAMGRSIAKAREGGVGTVTVRNSNHYAASCHYPLLAVEEGLAGLAMTTTAPVVVPTFGAAPLLGANPLCIAFPGGARERPFVIDMSTSVAAPGTIRAYGRAGRPLPEGWALDEALQPTTDARVARYLHPLGGDREGGSQKGYGLNVAVDLFAALLSGGRYSAQLGAASGAPPASRSAQMFSAWLIESFVPPEEYAARFDEYVATLRACPPIAGAERVFVPGEPEWLAEDDRRVRGIPLHPVVVNELRLLGRELGIPFPE